MLQMKIIMSKTVEHLGITFLLFFTDNKNEEGENEF